MRFDSDIGIKVRDAYAARHEPEAVRFLARVYWAFLILICTALVVTSIAYGVWEFVRVPTHEESLVNVRPQTTFTKADLQMLLKGFGDRAGQFEQRMMAPAGAKDPS